MSKTSHIRVGTLYLQYMPDESTEGPIYGRAIGGLPDNAVLQIHDITVIQPEESAHATVSLVMTEPDPTENEVVEAHQ